LLAKFQKFFYFNKVCERSWWDGVNCRHFLAWCKRRQFGGRCSTTLKEPNFSTS